MRFAVLVNHAWHGQAQAVLFDTSSLALAQPGFFFVLFVFHLDNFKYPTGHWSPVTHGIALTVTVDSERRADCDVPTPSFLPISPAFATSLWIEGCVAARWTRDGVNGARYVMYMRCDVVRPPTGFLS